jgi:hypothetical protein
VNSVRPSAVRLWMRSASARATTSFFVIIAHSYKAGAELQRRQSFSASSAQPMQAKAFGITSQNLREGSSRGIPVVLFYTDSLGYLWLTAVAIEIADAKVSGSSLIYYVVQFLHTYSVQLLTKRQSWC